MSWQLYRWVWQLDAPLSVGFPPAGSLNRCRPYLPAQVMRAALVSELARTKGGAPDYGKMGHEFSLSCRLTYLFPAEEQGVDKAEKQEADKSGDRKFSVWLPKFKGDGDSGRSGGLRWCRSDGGASKSDREFRRMLFDTRPGTAVEPQSDSAAEGTLRETECIGPYWRSSSSCKSKARKPVLLLGYFFLKNGNFKNKLAAVDTLYVGGDTRYGLGAIRRVAWEENCHEVFDAAAPILDDEVPCLESDVVWGHAVDPFELRPEPQQEHETRQKQQTQGARELLRGWHMGSLRSGACHLDIAQSDPLPWVPGSSFPKQRWSLASNGWFVPQQHAEA